MNEPMSSFDLDTYAARYKGRGKVQRLRFIAQRAPELATDALRAAVTEAKKGRDTVQYRELFAQADEPLGAGYDLDKEWIADNDLWAARQLQSLRHELDDNKQQANKEVIRTGHNALGDFFHTRGRLQNARTEYIKAGEYRMHADHTLQMCLKVIITSVEDDDLSLVENHFMLAGNLPDVDRTNPLLAKMRACSGLAYLVRGSYAQAASRFLNVNTERKEDEIASLQKQFGDVMALEDIAIYGGLCALATMDRPALTKQVIDAPEFRNLLELVPDVREIIHDFHNTRYTRCLNTMEKIRGELMLDMYLGKQNHVELLYRLIRRKAIVQYVSPFLSADLRRMGRVFKTTGAELEKELLSLIESGAIKARIDVQNNALWSKKVNVRANAIARSLELGQDAFDEAEAMLLRIALSKQNVVINSSSGMRGQASLGPRGASVNSVVDTIFESHFRSS